MKELESTATPQQPAPATVPSAANPADSEGSAPGPMSFREVTEDSGRSPLTKYQMLCLGNTKFSELIRYEILMLLVNDLPGLLGLTLRRVFYKRLFRKVGRGVVFGRSLVIRQPAKIEIGNGTLIDDRSILTVRGSARSGISIGRDVFVGRDTTLNSRDGTIEIGDSVVLSSSVRIGSTSRVVLGKHVLVGAFSYIGGASRKFDRLDVPIAHQGSELRGGVVIEDDVFLGGGVIVNDGVRIGRGSVVGAGSVVTRDLPAYSVAVGAPAKVVRSRKDAGSDEQST
jgi:acetyltransferase-like isoleucine patch superfamily enzyme